MTHRIIMETLSQLSHRI